MDTRVPDSERAGVKRLKLDSHTDAPESAARPCAADDMDVSRFGERDRMLARALICGVLDHFRGGGVQHLISYDRAQPLHGGTHFVVEFHNLGEVPFAVLVQVARVCGEQLLDVHVYAPHEERFGTPGMSVLVLVRCDSAAGQALATPAVRIARALPELPGFTRAAVLGAWQRHGFAVPASFEADFPALLLLCRLLHCCRDPMPALEIWLAPGGAAGHYEMRADHVPFLSYAFVEMLQKRLSAEHDARLLSLELRAPTTTASLTLRVRTRAAPGAPPPGGALIPARHGVAPESEQPAAAAVAPSPLQRLLRLLGKRSASE